MATVPGVDRTSWQRSRARARRAVAGHRRSIAALLAAGAVASGVHAARPSPPETGRVAVVTRDLPAGHRLEAGDVRSQDVPTGLVPDGALTASQVPVGRPLAAPVAAGSLLTDLSVVSPTALDAHPEGTVLATVRITDPAATEVVDVGDRVSVLAADLQAAGAAAVVARRVLVVSLPGEDQGGGLGQGAPVVVAVDEPTALALADATVGGTLSLVLTG